MGRPIVLDRETCFMKWVELGYQKNVGKWFEEQGIINPFTGKRYSDAAISYAARRWVCENSKKARKYYETAGMYLEDDEWDKWLVRTILRCFHSHNKSVIRKLLDENGLMEKYGYIIGEP